MHRNRTVHRIRSPRIREKLRLAVASDLHSAPFDDVLEDFAACDAVLIPGDLVDRHRRDNRNAYRFLQEVPDIVPVFYSIGNHEWKMRRGAEQYMAAVRDSRVTLLDNRYEEFRGILIGGASSTKTKVPDREFLERFAAEPRFKLLMCHHPEMYRDHIWGSDIDFTVCGHAHGGQIQLFGRGLYAPGQGLFPRLTHGLYDGGKMMVSRGMTNGAKPRIPRINNPCELIILELEPETGNPEEEE